MQRIVLTFGLIGGVKTMGFLGLFIGPVLMALLVAIWREWIREIEMTDGLRSGTVGGAPEPPPLVEDASRVRADA